MRYSVHLKDTGMGSVKNVLITEKHEHSAEVRARGEIRERVKKIKKRWPKSFKYAYEENEREQIGLCMVEEWQHSAEIRRSTGLYFRACVNYGHVAYNAGVDAAVLPVRLIDIQATLDGSVPHDGGICFVQPVDWSFHILSHTWSKAVRDFSVLIGERVTCAADYNEAFKGAKLNELSGDAGACYYSLLAFFRLLREEGVKLLWFDALCINQTDNEEKDREISRMGPYYRCSLGCYVLCQGMAQGFKLWNESRNRPHDLPRWFKRVWTLQEFLLPAKVTFMVEGLAKKTIGYLNYFIRKGDASGFCNCARPPIRGAHTVRTALGKLKCREEDEIICSSHNEGRQAQPCDKCAKIEFIRKSHEQPGLYFVDRAAYIFLCQLDQGAQHAKALVQSDDTTLWDLFALANHPCSANTFKIVEMLRKRECTNAEDRVLGVLGLLGKPSELQLRSGKDLSEQILNLHRYCDLPTFFRLCLLVEPTLGFPAKGMSWAPYLEPTCAASPSLLSRRAPNCPEPEPYSDYCNPVELGRWPGTELFRPTATVVNVYRRGLVLGAPVAYGRLVPRGQSMRCIPCRPGREVKLHFDTRITSFGLPIWERFHSHDMEVDEFVCYSCILHGIHDNCTHWSRECELELGERSTFPLTAHAREGCGVKPLKQGHIVIQDLWIGNSKPNKINGSYAQFFMSFQAFSIHALKPFPVWLMLLGEIPDQIMLGMMCIAESDRASELHKIGVFACPKSSLPTFFPPKLWLIGGFGEDVRSYVSAPSSQQL